MVVVVLMQNKVVGKILFCIITNWFITTLNTLLTYILVSEEAIKVHLAEGRTDLEEFASKLEMTLNQWYPYIKGLLSSDSSTPNYSPPVTINVFFERMEDKSTIAMASSEGRIILGNIDYYQTHQHDVGSMIHELVHLIQEYPKNVCPTWLIEGIADYVRYYHFHRQDQHTDRVRGKLFLMPRKPSRRQSWRDGYATTAFFLDYVVANVREDFLYWINKSCRDGHYRESIWKKLTGHSIIKLWRKMIKNG